MAATVALRDPTDKAFSQATGFFIAPRIVVTCAHVTEEVIGDRDFIAESNGRHFALRATADGCFKNDEGLDVAFLTLAEESEPEHSYVVVSDGLVIGDRLWAFGFPEGRYQGGKPANFVCEGFSKLHQGT